MELSWLNRKHNQECILFFNGWGMDPTPFTGIPFGVIDVVMAWDYRQPGAFPQHILERYRAVHLAAWSMGVWAAATWLHKAAEHFASTTAIAGTLDPIHDRCGLPEAAYNTMADAFTSARLASFHLSMFDDQGDHQRFIENKPRRPDSELAVELNTLRDTYRREGTAPNIYTNVLLTSRDQVFPLRNQLRAWKGVESRRMNWTHFPFYSLPDWQALVPKNTKK